MSATATQSKKKKKRKTHVYDDKVDEALSLACQRLGVYQKRSAGPGTSRKLRRLTGGNLFGLGFGEI